MFRKHAMAETRRRGNRFAILLGPRVCVDEGV